MRVLVTGGLGFIGSEVVRALLARADVERVTLLARGRAGVSAAERFAKQLAIWERFTGSAVHAGRVEIVEHDLAQSPPPRLDDVFDCVIHSAASTDLGAPLDQARRSNLYATEKLLLAVQTLTRLRRFVHLSTAYVCGRRIGVIREDDRTHGSFHNDYERSKWEAEACIRASGLPYTILRPSMVVGRSDDGFVQQMKVLYAVWRVWLLGILPRAPISPGAWVDIVPVDYVASAVVTLMLRHEAVGRTLHLCAGADRQRISTILEVGSRVLEVNRPKTWPVGVAYAFKRLPLSLMVPHSIRELLDYMVWHLPYMSLQDRLYDTQSADRLLADAGVLRPVFAEYGDVLFRFLRDTSWGKRPAAGCDPKTHDSRATA